MKNQASRFAPRGQVRGAAKGLASRLMRAGSVAAFRAAAPLPKDAQELIDKAVVNVALDRLTIVRDLMAAGLTVSLPNWLAVPTFYWEKQSRAGQARRVMAPKSRGENWQTDREGVTIPIFATIDNFELGIREQMASERAGAPLDTSGAQNATRNVNEAHEDAAINGAGITVAGFTAPGVLAAPSVNSYTYASNVAWDNAGKTGAQILADLQGMLRLLHAKRMFGPYGVWVPTSYGIKIDDDFKANGDQTIRERLLKVEGVQFIHTADQLPTDRVVMAQLTSDVVDVVVGEEPTHISWEDGSGMEQYHMILSCLVTRWKDTYDDQSGVCVGNV